MLTRRAEQGDLSAVFQLFCATFPDGGSGFNRTYFNNVWKPENTLLIFDGDIAAMLQHWTVGSRQGKCSYVYGVATRPEYRGRGLASKLLEQVPLPHVLICESADVFSFYKKLGYDESFFVKKCSAPRDETADIRPLRDEDIPRVLEIYRAGGHFLHREEKLLRQMLEFYPGQAIWDGGELTAYKIGPLEALGERPERFGGSFLCPVNSPCPGEIMPFGCSKGLELAAPEYINLLFN
ncbi:MAG: GNAT family N-acetyltransferase [Oscillospiraceae bacterium]|nr:GNAT family N-acetyltransferase [Oscillospiraceae bacterium]